MVQADTMSVAINGATTDRDRAIYDQLVIESGVGNEYFGSPANLWWSGDKSDKTAVGFDHVSAITSAGEGQASLPTSGLGSLDTSVLVSEDAYVLGAGYLNYTREFSSVTKFSEDLNDRAISFDLAGDDRLSTSLERSSLSESGFAN